MTEQAIVDKYGVTLSKFYGSQIIISWRYKDESDYCLFHEIGLRNEDEINKINITDRIVKKKA